MQHSRKMKYKQWGILPSEILCGIASGSLLSKTKRASNNSNWLKLENKGKKKDTKRVETEQVEELKKF